MYRLGTHAISSEEPFDEGFDRHIWALSEQSLKWDKEIAEKRRTKPQEAEKLMKELLADRQALDELLAQDLADLDDELDPVNDDRTLAVCTVAHIMFMIVFAVPEMVYEKTENTAQKSYAIAEELKQVPLTIRPLLLALLTRL